MAAFYACLRRLQVRRPVHEGAFLHAFRPARSLKTVKSCANRVWVHSNTRREKTMTVYGFLKRAARSHSGIVDGGRTDEIRFGLTARNIWSGMKAIVLDGKIACPHIALENGEAYRLDDLIQFSGDPYAEIERLYAQYRRSVPSRHEKLNRGYFKALSSDALTMKELEENMPRSQARIELEGFILLAASAGLIPWDNPKHFFWRSQSDPDCIIYRDWVLDDDVNKSKEAEK